jgi:hypothetical protein
MANGIGGHQSKKSKTQEWLTPPHIIEALGRFDLDPCAPVNRPWDTARRHYVCAGLNSPWEGRVWLNPPYQHVDRWLHKMVEHGNGIALLFARTETRHFFKYVWREADGILFLKGRLTFYHKDGTAAKSNCGAPSVLVAYGRKNARVLKKCRLDGAYVPKSRLNHREGLFDCWRRKICLIHR